MSLTRWVQDRLHDILGFSDTTTAQYIIAAAKKAPSSAALVSSLQDVDVPISASTTAFAAELFGKVAVGKKPAVRAEPKSVRTNAELMLEQENYSLVGMDEEAMPSSRGASSSKHEKRKKHTRKKAKYDSSSSEDEAPPPPKRSNTADGDGLTPEERARDADQRDKEAFEERLQARDEDKTRKVGHAKNLTQEQIAELSTKGDFTAQLVDATMDRRREISRQQYLEKREAKELEIMEWQIKDEEYMFQGERRTAAEKKRMELNRKIIDQARKRVTDTDQHDGYRMPDAYEDENGNIDKEKKEAALHERYEEEPEFKTEQEEWEEHQMATAKMPGGAKDRAQQEEYDYVFEDQIEFISQEMLKGKDMKLPEPKSIQDEGGEATNSLTEGRKKLPIYPYREDLLEAVRDNQVLVIVGETGSGKTTQIMQYMHEVGYTKVGKVGCTQPRRVAAMSVAARVAQEVGVKLGAEVGYSIRFEDCTSDETVVKYMTDGMLLREFLTEPDLRSYSVIMVDEAHERTLHTDVLFGLVKDIVRFRDDIKLLISSATLDAQKFADYFDDAPIFVIPGRMYPVDILYTKAPEADYLDACAVTALQVHVTQPLGDVLVFLTGQEEIETCKEVLEQRTKGMASKMKELLICPIYSTLPAEEQAKIFEPTPPDARKVVLATNIAETSLTINGICYVIDAGFCKQKTFNPRSGMESLIVTPISKAHATQRAGRAGRTQPGKCFRLYTAWSFKHELDENPVPEIQRTNLGNVVLMLKSLGINDLLNFDFMDKPPAETLIRALEQLYALGSLNDHGELTKLGRRMAEFPLDPQMSKAVIQSERYGCTEQILTVMSMLSIGASVFYRPKEKAIHADNARLNFARGGDGDHISLLRVYEQWAETNFSTQWCYENFVQVRSLKKAQDIREQLDGLCERVEVEKSSNSQDMEIVRKAICTGFFYHTSKLDKTGYYKTVKHQHTVHIHPSSCLYKEEERPRWLLYHELAYTSQEYMRQVIPVKPQWLVEIAPHFYKAKELEDSTTKKMPKGQGAVKQD
jgi:pre-mRNA-splicing factor ATP-dependent RNA helicase DHX16